MLNAYQYILTIMRKQKFLLAGYVISAVISTVISHKLVMYKPEGLVGTSLTYLISMTIVVVCFTLIFLFFLAKKKSEN